MVDGDLSTAWSGPQPPYWFEIDLGVQVLIDSVRLQVGQDLAADVRVNVGAHDNPGRNPGTFERLESGEWLVVEVGYEARFVRVSVDATETPTAWLEVQVLSP